MTPTEQAVEAVGAVGAVARITRIDGAAGVWHVHVRCPFCGRQHTHSGGPTGETPTLGVRASHCHRGEYVLAWTEDAS